MKRGKFIKEIYLGHGLYKRIYEDAWLKADLEKGVMSDNTGKTFSQKMQDELEPIVHPTEHDESDDIEAAKRSVWGEWNEAAERDFFKGEKWEYKK